MTVYEPPTATEHLRGTPNMPRWNLPSQVRHVQRNRPKTYRIALHSDNRISGTPTNAVFHLGDLKGAWLLSDNLDVGRTHYVAKVQSFFCKMSVEPSFLEIRGVNWPHQSESFDSATQGPTQLLAVAQGNAECAVGSEIGLALRDLPSGNVGIRLVERDNQSKLDADAAVKWHLVVSTFADLHTPM